MAQHYYPQKRNTMQTKKTIRKITYFLIFTVLLSFQTITAQTLEEKVSKALTDTSIKTRGKLQKESTKFRFDYHDVYQNDSQAKYLQSNGFHGGGPSWLGIIYGAFKMGNSDLIDTIEMKVEVTGITFWSDSKEELDMIGRVIAVIKSDEKVLLESIEYAKEYEMML